VEKQDTPLRNLKMVIEYDGSCYCGWQRQHNGVAIQQLLEEAVATITCVPTTVFGSGRTDAGVHAIGQVANFRTRARIPLPSFLKGLNSLLPADIAVKELEEVQPDFHARYSAYSKVYRYQIWNQPLRAPLLRNFTWFVHVPLEVTHMEEALSLLRGRHDFSAFCAAGDESASRVRNILAAEIARDPGGMLRIEIEADGFLRHMVRNIVGTLVEVGRGKRLAVQMSALIACRDRRQAGVTAPPQGLFLLRVNY